MGIEETAVVRSMIRMKFDRVFIRILLVKKIHERLTRRFTELVTSLYINVGLSRLRSSWLSMDNIINCGGGFIESERFNYSVNYHKCDLVSRIIAIWCDLVPLQIIFLGPKAKPCKDRNPTKLVSTYLFASVICSKLWNRRNSENLKLSVKKCTIAIIY